MRIDSIQKKKKRLGKGMRVRRIRAGFIPKKKGWEGGEDEQNQLHPALRGW